MFLFLLTFVIVTSGCGAQVSDESCDTNDLKKCVVETPRTQIGLPRSREELDALCLAYQTGMACMDTWIKRCFPTDDQKFIQKQTSGARLLMHFLCNNETSIRKDYLSETTCWAVVSPEWSSCVDDLQFEVRDISELWQNNVNFNKNAELCCARDAFITCVVIAGEVCSPKARHLLQQMAWTLSKDVVTCSPQVYCAASWSHIAPAMLTALSGALLYPPRLYV